MTRFVGKNVVVLGGATGIGAATVRRFLEEGAAVHLGDVNTEGLEALSEKLGSPKLTTQFADQGDPKSVQELIEAAQKRLGRIDCMHLNGANTSDFVRDTDIVSVDMSVFDRIMQVNLYGYLYAIRFALPRMLQDGGGAIVCTSSEAAISTDGTVPAYVISKSAVNGLIRHVAARYGSEGIRCNAILPGLILTESMERLTTLEQRQHSLKTLHSIRIGSPDDIAGMVLHLCADDGVYINGQSISINGGSRM